MLPYSVSRTNTELQYSSKSLLAKLPDEEEEEEEENWLLLSS